jgi:membrane-bound metal-dependent hydrolase YbcI (DUF457 family)
MDIVHHMFIGCAGFVISTGTGHEVAGAAFVAGSVLPDLDVAFMAFGKRFYLQNHQGITHSLLAAPLYAAIIICLPLLWLLDLQWQWPVFFAALSGLCIHICLDLFNTFRIQLFAPFIKQRYSFDAVFFIDSVAIFMTALFYFLHTYLVLEISMLWYPFAFASYFFAKWRLRIKVQSELACDFAIPSALNPFEFYVLTRQDERLKGCIFNAMTKRKKGEVDYPIVDQKYLDLANKSQTFSDMLGITRAFYITEIIETEESTQLIAQDLAVRNFGGHFAKTTLMFNKQGELLSESANI